MATRFHNNSKLVTSLAVIGFVFGCSAVGMGVQVAELATIVPNPDTLQNEPRHNYYEPTILASNLDMIRVKYIDVNSYAQHEEALQLIRKHCGASYTETYRAKIKGYTIVEAECTHDTDF